MARFGSDKPDLRFGLELRDVTELTRGSEFKVFADAPSVQCLTMPRELSRSELASLEELAKEWGAKGLAYLVFDEAGEVRSPVAKFLSDELTEALRPDQASTILFGADEPGAVARVLSAVRNQLGREYGLIDEARDELLWVTDFPLFEWDEDGNRWTFSHHPFTGVRPGDEDLIETDPGRAISQAYDLVWNGWELGSGSIRIHDPALRRPRRARRTSSWSSGGAAPRRRAAGGRRAARARRRAPSPRRARCRRAEGCGARAAGRRRAGSPCRCARAPRA